MVIEIKSRWFNRVLHTVQADKLAGADLEGADLKGAYLRGADLEGANLIDENENIPVIPDLDKQILAAIEAGGSLDMSAWHSTECETTHCRAGWATTIAGQRGKELEDKYSYSVAGYLLYNAAYPDMPPPNFYATDKDAMEDIRKRAALAETAS